MRIALAATIFTAVVGTAPAAAQFYPPAFSEDRRAEQDIGGQLDDIYETIEQARRSGRFSAPEARALHREGQRLFDDFQYMRRDGLDPREFRRLDEGVLALRERLERRLRFGDWRDGRDDGYREARPWGHEDWRRGDRGDGFDRRFPDQERNRDSRRDDVWWQDENAAGEEPWRNEPVETPDRRDEGWATAPDRDDDRTSEGARPGGAGDDWWLPPEERETIESRPGDRPPGGDD